MSDIIELFGVSTSPKNNPNWNTIINEKVKDFVGIELQTLDTTGTVWPAWNLIRA